MHSVWPAILVASIAALALVGGASLPAMRLGAIESRLSLLIGFSAGLMLATSLHELIPEAIERSGERAMWGTGFGFLLLYTAERFTHFHACRHRGCEAEDTPRDAEDASLDAELAAGMSIPLMPVGTPAPTHNHHHHSHFDRTAMVGMSIHNMADGLTAAAAFSLSTSVGMVVVLAIVLHQMAAGLSLGAILLRAGRDRRGILISTAIVASFIVWGAVLYLLVVPVGEGTQGLILGIAGGSFLYVAACDLLPEAHFDDEGWAVTATTLAGYAFTLITRAIFGAS